MHSTTISPVRFGQNEPVGQLKHTQRKTARAGIGGVAGAVVAAALSLPLASDVAMTKAEPKIERLQLNLIDKEVSMQVHPKPDPLYRYVFGPLTSAAFTAWGALAGATMGVLSAGKRKNNEQPKTTSEREAS